MSAAGLLALAACSISDLTRVPNTSNVLAPSVTNSYAGAINAYNGSRYLFEYNYASSSTTSFVAATGMIGDEYQSLQPQISTDKNLELDLRLFTTGVTDAVYTGLQNTRLNIGQAIQLLHTYAPTAPRGYTGELYALKGYIYIMVGELFCSGIPFSEAVFGGDLQLGRPLSMEQTFQAAAALFDTAMVAGADSLQILQLARVGKARALLDLGQYADAAALVTTANVPTSFTYTINYTNGQIRNYLYNFFAYNPTSSTPLNSSANHDGGTGLDYVTAGTTGGDPRMTMVPVGTTPVYFPRKWVNPADLTADGGQVALADGLEARLIEAEAQLQAGDIPGWTTTLNTLRASGMSTVIPPLTSDSTLTASDTLRVNVMFRERAFWLYGTGRRFGDMRRLVRQYHRPPEAVFPTGNHATVAPPYSAYGDQLVPDPPLTEQTTNPYFKDGCINHDA